MKKIRRERDFEDAKRFAPTRVLITDASGSNVKQIALNKKIHHKMRLIKFYTGIKMIDLCSTMLYHALNSPMLEEILMSFLGNPAKVRKALKLIKDEWNDVELI